MDYEMFKTFIHPDLLIEFTKLRFTDASNKEFTYEQTLINAFNLANGDYATLYATVSAIQVYPKFSQEEYVLKSAFIKVYKWMLGNTAFLENLNLSGVIINDSDIFKHFESLLKMEQDDYEEMRKEVMTEYTLKNGTGGLGGCRLFFSTNKDAYGVNISSRRARAYGSRY